MKGFIIQFARRGCSCDFSTLLLPAGRPADGSQPKEHGEHPEQVQPGRMPQGDGGVLEKEMRLDELRGGFVVRLRGLRDAAQGEIVGDRRAPNRRTPGDGATADCSEPERGCKSMK
jgi:hypothetical protein